MYNICTMKYVYNRTCVYNIHYHIVWSVKYRNKVLSSEIAAFLCELLKSIGKEKGFSVDEVNVGFCDHVHCFVSAPPKLSITSIVRYLKGISGIQLFAKYPELRKSLWRGELWNGSYFVETIGSTNEENIKKYIERQSRCQK